MAIKRIAVTCVHTSPLDSFGGKKTGGMNIYVREMARELGTRDIEVDIFTRRQSPQTAEVNNALGDNVRVIQVPCGPPMPLDPDAVYPHLQQFTAGVIAFNTKTDGRRYDLTYSHYWLSGLVAHKLKEVWGLPFAQMFHTLGYMKHRITPDFSGRVANDVRTTNETKLVGWADRIIAATPAEHAQLLWLYRADRRRIAVVPPGVDAALFKPVSELEAKLRLGYRADERVFLFVGRIEPLKAIDTILEAIHILRAGEDGVLDGVRFAIIGGDHGDPELVNLMQLAETLGVADVVDFLGAREQDMLPDYYAASTAVIMPSDYESFGMVALEAMASGTPVIASQVGGLAYLVRDNETGYLVPSREPHTLAARIHALITQPEEQERLGRNAAKLAQQYAWPRITERLLTVFAEMIGARAR